MAHALVTIVCPLATDRVPEAEAAIDRLDNPARPDIQTALDRLDGDAGTHFASLHAIRSCDGLRAYIVLEFSADGTEAAAIRRLTGAIGESILPVFRMTTDWTPSAELEGYLARHSVTVGGGWFSNPGTVFAGTPGLSVGQIRAEAALADQVGTLVGRQDGDMRALDRLEAVRGAFTGRPEMAPYLAPGTPPPPYSPPGKLSLIAQMAGAFIKTYLWPAGVVLLVWALISLWLGRSETAGLVPVLWDAAGWFLRGFLIVLVLLLGAALAAYAVLLRAEANDWLEERTAERATQKAMFERENRLTQNHMVSITQRKPGLVRRFTSRLIFWAIAELAARSYPPGFLSDIGTIHFARWVTPPKSSDVLFFSNFDGSWESYLEDFITRAHLGLTGVWSNSIGFPRSANLVQKGATDGERFKRYARHSMQPTRFWYSAYPKLTTTEIRTNSQIRRGLSGAMTEDEAKNWLALFGSAGRPASKLVTNEIQSLVFGGLRFMPFGTCLLFNLPDATASARAWLRDVRPHVAYNDGRRLAADAVVTLALGAPGLARLGLPEQSLETFPYAFQEGMVTEARSRILDDRGANAPSNWWWGQRQLDVALLVYGRTDSSVAELEAKLAAIGAEHGATLIKAIPLRKVTDDKREAFGFVDGISQPVIRGTYKGLRNADPIHLVEAGEFILGYPDNRGNMPPGPTLPATADTANLLPLSVTPAGFDRTVVEAPRDLGCNGSFLVIRQLEQDREVLDRFCEAESERLKDRLAAPYDVNADFIAAKLVGRWRDGSSLVRHPYQSRSAERDKEKTKATIRPTTHPDNASAIERPVEPMEFGDNNFLFGTEDPEALRCPFGAHIRRSNPRDSLVPGSKEQIDISNRHRIIRVGRQYVPEAGQKPGLLFMCLNGDIERQFEFVQQTWLMSPAFHGLSHEKDPLLGDGEHGECGFTIASRDGPVRLSRVPRVITTRGGGYFFLPGKRLIDYLSSAG
jgi:deferrochelatase/peroxidase EfeB